MNAANIVSMRKKSKKIKYFFQNITILNLALVIAMSRIIQFSVFPFFEKDIRYTLPAQNLSLKREEVNMPEFTPPSQTDYINIADDNLFHPERRIPPEKKVEIELPKPDFVLYGTMVTDDLKIAYLEDLKTPRSTPGRGKRQTAVKKDDIYSGFTLKEVEIDRIVMTRGEEHLIVNVMDKRKAKMREAAMASEQTPSQQAAPNISRRAAAVQKAQEASQPAASPKKDNPMPLPPRSSLESAVYDYFKIGK